MLDQSHLVMKHLGKLPVYAASSCQQIHELKPESPSGMYWIQSNSSPSRVYCQMEEGGCGHGVWMRVANVNMTATGASCPSGLVRALSSRPLCRRSTDSCSSTFFSSFDVPFHNVCGKIIAYQYYSPDAFNPYSIHQTRTVDDLYVDGIVVTHSHSPRQHIWTFAAGLQETVTTNVGSIYSCPCSFTKSRIPYGGKLPEFIGNDYFCETACRTTYSDRYYWDDPLWDGKGCGRFSTCCEGKGKPWFVKRFSESISSQIEVRVCCDQDRSNEDIAIEQIEIYVQ